MPTVVITPWPVFRVGPCFVLPLHPSHWGMTDSHRHLCHQLITVVMYEPKQGTLLWGREHSKHGSERIAQAVEAEVRSASSNVADEISTSILKPVL